MRALFRSPTGLGALLFGLVLLAYFPSIFCGFIWDDDVGIINNENLRTLDGLGRIWSDPSKTPQGHYWPMVYTTFWLEYRLWGLNPAGYHVVNILLQAINSLLLWRLLLRLEVPGAWFVAALFGVHPIQVESVAWIIERKNLLCGFFSLSTVLLFMMFMAKKSWTAYIGAIVLFVFAMLSKSSAFSLPFVLIILVGWRYPKEFLKRCCWTLPFLAIGSVIAWWDVSLVQKKEVIEHGLSWFDRLVISGKAFWFYPFKILIPANFVAVYPKWEVESFSKIDLVWPISVTLVGMLLLALAWKGRPGVLTAYALYAVLLAPTVGFVDFGFMALSFVADRFVYLACIPLFALVVGGMRMVIQQSGNRGFWQIVIGGLLGVLVLFSAIQCRVYKNQETLVRHNLKKYPEAWIVRYNFAIDLASLERYDEAVEQYEKLILSKPDFIDARNNLGTLWVRLGQPEKAEKQFLEILRIDPDNARAYQNLGVLQARRGDFQAALQNYRRSLAIDPGNESVKEAISGLTRRLELNEKNSP